MGLFDDLLPQPDAPRLPVMVPPGTERLGGAPLPNNDVAGAFAEAADTGAQRIEIPTAQAPPNIFGDMQPGAAPPVAPEATTGERFALNAREAWRNTAFGSLLSQMQSGEGAAAMLDRVQRSIDEARAAGSDVALRRFANGQVVGWHGTPVADMEASLAGLRPQVQEQQNAFQAEDAQRRAEYAGLRPFYQNPTDPARMQSATAGLGDMLTSLLGQIVGGMGSPEGVPLNLPEGAGATVIRRFLGNAGLNALPNVVADPTAQALQVSAGTRQAVDPLETAVSTAVSGLIGGSIATGPEIVRQLSRKIGEAMGRGRDVPIRPEDVTPEAVRAAMADPEIARFMEANGITSPTDPRVAQLQERVPAIRAQEADLAQRPPNVDRVQLRSERENVTIDPENNNPAAQPAMMARREPTPEVIRLPDGSPERAPGATGAGDVRAGVDLRSRADSNLPAVVEPQPTRMTPGDVERARADMEGGQPQGRMAAPGQEHLDVSRAGDARATIGDPSAPPDRFVVPEGRAAQSIDQAVGQREASQAFQVADAQRARAGEGVADTQAGGRPQGRDAQPVLLDTTHPHEQFPVQELGREFVGKTEMVRVVRVDPRTGGRVDGAVEYMIPASSLRERPYSASPRMAQDFEARAQVGTVDKGKARGQRIDEAQGLDRQTYRTTPPDPNADLPGAGSGPRAEGPRAPHEGRSPLPEQPADAPERGRPWSSWEDIAKEFAARQARERAQRAESGQGGQRGSAGPDAEARARYERTSSSGTPKPPDGEGRFHTDEFGYVLSDKGGPVKYGTQQQAARAILDMQRRSPDQYFEIHNHPSGDGFTARERGRNPRNGGEGGPKGSEKTTDTPGDGPTGQNGAVPPNSEAPRGATGEGARAEPGASEAPGRSSGEPGKAPTPADITRTPPRSPGGGVRAPSDLSDFQGKFYAFPGGDPALWRWLGRTLTGPLRWAKREADAWIGSVRDVFGESFKGGMLSSAARAPGNVAIWVKDHVSLVLRSNDAMLRTYAARFESKAIRELADTFFARAGNFKEAVGKAFGQAVDDRVTSRLEGLARIFEPFAELRGSARADAMTQIGKLMREPGSIRAGTPIHDAAVALGKFLREELDYQRQAGVDMGEVRRGYLPRVADQERILRDPKWATDLMERAYRLDGLDAKAAREAAQHYFEAMQLNELGLRGHNNDFVRVQSASGSPNFQKGRVLSDKAEKMLSREGFYNEDVGRLLPMYVMRATRRAEWVRRMGAEGEKWAEIKGRILQDVAGKPHSAHVMSEIIDTIGSAGGMRYSGSSALRLGSGVMRTWGTLAYMSRAVYSSLGEPFIVAMRTGNLADGVKAYTHTLRAWTRVDEWPGVKNLAPAQRQQLLKTMAEDLGIYGRAIDDLGIQARLDGAALGRISAKIQSKFFLTTGLTQYTEATRHAAMRIGMTYMRRLALDTLAEGKMFGVIPTGSAFTDSAKLHLRELGIPDAQQAGFASWIKSQDDRPDLLARALTGKDPNAALYAAALSRFVNQTIMRPTAAEKPRYANGPMGAMVYQLQSYIHSFQKNVVNRVANSAIEAARPGNGLNALERMHMMAPLAFTPILLGITAGLNELRGQIWPRPDDGRPRDGTDKFLEVLSRSGMSGILDLPMNAIASVKYNRDPATTLLGPMLGMLSEGIKGVAGLYSDRNSPNTNTAERRAMTLLYTSVMQPVMVAGASLVGGSGRAAGMMLGAAAVQAAGHPAVREDVVGSVAGARAAPRGRGRPAAGRADRGR